VKDYINDTFEVKVKHNFLKSKFIVVKIGKVISKGSIKLFEIQPRVIMVNIRKPWKGIENFMEAVVMEWSTSKAMTMTLKDYI
jgi:hypothetical protein